MKAGDPIVLTTDLATAAGFALLLHEDEAVVAEDYRTLLKLQPTMFTISDAD